MSTENYDPCYPDQPVVHRYLPVWAKLPAFAAKLAFVWADDGDTAAAGVMSYATLTYSQLDAAVERMASGLLGALRRADTVLVLASPGLRLVKLLFACQRAGLTAVPVIPPDPSRPGAAHAHLLRAVWQTRPRAAIADARYIDAVKKSNAVVAGEPDQLAAMLRSLRWLSVDELEQGGANGAAPVTSFMGCETEDAHLIQYTSGATGAPKPVVITAGAAAHNVRAARKAYELHPGSVVVSWLPQYHDCGLMFLLLTVVAGATCVLASPDAFVRRPSLWLELVTEFKATCTPVPSFTLPLVLRRGRSPDGRRRRRPLELGSLENLILINEPIYKSCVDEFVAKFRGDGLHAASISPSYGLAENCTFVSTAWRSRRCVDLPSYKKLLPSARLSRMADEEPEIEIAVVDEETGEPVEDGVEGEIWVSSPSNASGYLGHPSASREVFCARLPGKGAGSSCYVRTGDRGVVRGAERYLYVVGRSADILALDDDGGHRSVCAHYIETAAFGGAPDRLRGGCIAAFTTSPAPSTSLVVVVAELLKGSGGRGSDHKDICEGIKRAVWEEDGVRVGWIVLVESGVVPKTTSGKLRRGAARDKLLAGKLPILFEARYDGAESSVPWAGGEEEMEKCPGMDTAYGSASRRLRLQSFL